jgi:hypothetical protein
MRRASWSGHSAGCSGRSVLRTENRSQLVSSRRSPATPRRSRGGNVGRHTGASAPRRRCLADRLAGDAGGDPPRRHDALARLEKRGTDHPVLGRTSGGKSRIRPPTEPGGPRLPLRQDRQACPRRGPVGVAPASLDTSSHSDADLLVPTGDEVPEPRNRRVEVTAR